MALLGVLVISLALSGCGNGFRNPGTMSMRSSRGTVDGGQQPVSGAKVFLYAVANTQSGTATSLLGGSGYVVTDSNGGFSLSNEYTCPANSSVYVLALGGNPGLAPGTNNPKLALAAGLGACSALSSSTFITINEVTTVATASALAAIATTETQVGSPSSAIISSSFTTLANLVDPASGIARSATLDGTGTVPQSKLNSLADALAACVNSDGTGMPCASLMTAANVSSANGGPVDTMQAALNIAHAPGNNVQAIYNQVAASAPFQPTLTSAPTDWSISIQYGGAAGVTLSPASATIQQTAPQTLSASAGTGAGANTSYLWTTTARAGTLTGNSTSGQTSFCTASAQVTYQPNATPALAADTTDTVSVTVFNSANCSAGSALGSASASITVALPPSATTLAGLPTRIYTATVVLPSGSRLRPDALSVQDSLARTTPGASGTFTIPAYNNGEQIVFISAPDGTPMMMGWMDANHTTVSARTTAEVLAFYALGGASMLTEADRENTVLGIPALPAFPAFANTVAAELAANPDTFAQRDSTVADALNALVASTTGVTPQPSSASGVRANDIIVAPTAITAQSGISLSSTPPPPPYFTNNPQTPFSTYLTNSFRRRTHAFVIRQKDTLAGTDTPNGAQIADFDVAPTAGLNGGVTGALTDIIKAYFGSQPTAYSPVTGDPFDLPVDSGFDSTTYQIINVGPGASNKPHPVQLTSAQQAILVTTSVNSFVSDVLVPFVNNVILGSGSDADATNNLALSGQQRSEFVLALEANVAAFVNSLPGEQDKLVAGDYKGVAGDLLFNSATFPGVSNAITSALTSAASSAGLSTVELTAGLEKWNRIMYGAGAGLQVFDSVVYLAQLKNSDTVDVWNVTSTNFHATLSPSSATLNGIGNTSLTANVLNVDSSALLSWQYTLVPASGQQPIGTLTGSGGSVPDSNGKLTFCSSSPNASYSNNAAAVANLTAAATDTVTVTAFAKANCLPANKLSDTASATITTNPNGSVSLSPAAPTINPGDQVTLTARYTDPKATTPVIPSSWLFLLTAGSYPGPSGTISSGGQGPDAGSRSGICSQSPTVSYQSTTSFPLASPDQDLIQVRAYTGSNCDAGTGLPASGTSVGFATVTTSGAARLRVNSNSTIKAGAQVSLTAAFRLGLANTPTPGSYQWTTTGTYGSLTEVGGAGRTGQTTYCSTSAAAIYASTANPNLTTPVADTVTVTPFADTQCTVGKADGLSGTATMNIEPPPGPFVTPGQITSVLQSGDGNFYASASSLCGIGNNDSCDYILRIDTAGTVTVLHTFELGNNNYNMNDDGSGVTGILEGRDGALYGSARNGGPYGTGTIFRLAHDGTFTLLQTYPTVTYGIGGYGTTYHCGNYQVGTAVDYTYGGYPGPLTEGADGNLYGLSHYGVKTTEGGFFQITPTGSFTLLHSFIPVISTLVGGSGPGNCGATIVSTPKDPVYISPDFSLDPPQPLQALDGSFYAQMTGRDTGVELDTLSRLLGTEAVPTYNLTTSNAGRGTNAQLIGGSNGGLYSSTSAGDFVFLNGNLQLLNSAPLPLTILGSDNNFYTTSAVTGGQSNSLTQVTPLGASSVFAAIRNSAPNSSVQATNGTGPVLEAANGDLVGGAAGYDLTKPSGQQSVYFLFDVPSAGQLTGPVHLSFPAATAKINQAVQLTWTVANAFSLTAQQCHATVQQPAQGSTAGAGNWSGAQYGALSGGVYTGSVEIVPTVAGTYTYALTCGGKESGFATLTVQ